ncbi:MAG: alpha/beta fold hydrolase [Promethearchaeota archaeon]
MQNIIFIHGLESTGKGFKSQLLKKIFPHCLTPDFESYNPHISINLLLEKRMNQLNNILEKKNSWIIIGSSFGGLMGTIYACLNPLKVKKLILLAPFLSTSLLNQKTLSSIDIPVIIYHGKYDNVVSMKNSAIQAQKLFSNLTYNVVDDDHKLQKTTKNIDWKRLILNL